MANLVCANYRLFNWSYNNASAAHGMAEMSDLKDVLHDRWQHLGHDKKGVMVQGRSAVIPFVVTTEEYDDNGDVSLWRLVSDHEKYPGCTLTVFND